MLPLGVDASHRWVGGRAGGGWNLLGASKATGRGVRWGPRAHRVLGSTQDMAFLRGGGSRGGWGGQVPAEPLTFEPEICWVISRCRRQGQSPCRQDRRGSTTCSYLPVGPCLQLRLRVPCEEWCQCGKRGRCALGGLGPLLGGWARGWVGPQAGERGSGQCGLWDEGALSEWAPPPCLHASHPRPLP